MSRRVVVALATLAALALVTGCTTDDAPSTTPSAGPTAIRTLVPLPPVPEPPPTGRLLADMRQSSIDASLAQMQVWVDNDTERDLVPTRIVYRDPRFARPIAGQSLREDPAQSERGYPLALPRRPRCGSDAPAESGVLEVRHGGEVERVPVTDPTDVVGRYLVSRCSEIALAAFADVRFDDAVPASGPGEDTSAVLSLLVRPTGAAGRLVLHTVAGSHLLGPLDGEAAWTPELTVTGAEAPRRVELPIKTSRCDGHAFAEGGGATAFRLAYDLDGEPGEVLLRMDDAGRAAMLDWAATSCGLDS